ncbi:hypothetical protein CgunFtcFv8_003953 [Champsocephalus gunnari]|uniref:Uncharacterized protein n=1 Tax=Champsocephalus gunnari TaxID=52237 RepID=A0AAN8E207_CHAGU|nr:hypothetical protein CgunFtcFv8_003953 [Champsocephalus gunnari]
MWTEVKNRSRTVTSGGNSSMMVDSDLTLLQNAQHRNASTAAATRPSHTEDSLTSSSGIIPGAIAATVFIAFLLALYAVLWKCMVSPPQRKHCKIISSAHTAATELNVLCACLPPSRGLTLVFRTSPAT